MSRLDRLPHPLDPAQRRQQTLDRGRRRRSGFLDLGEPLGARGSALYDEAVQDQIHPTGLYQREIAIQLFQAIWFPLEPRFPDRLREGTVKLAAGLATVKTPT